MKRKIPRHIHVASVYHGFHYNPFLLLFVLDCFENSKASIHKIRYSGI